MPRLFTTARLALATGLMLALAVPAWAQTRSDTGRHKPQPKPVEKRVQDPAATGGQPDHGWTFGVSAGVLGAGDAFQVETLEGVSVPWVIGGDPLFQASRFNATFDQNLSLGLQVGKGLGRHLAAQLSAGYSRMDLGAEALVGQTGTVVLLDRVDVVQAGAGLVARLTAAPSHPFASAEAVLTSLSAGRLEDLDQSSAGWRVGLGYRQVFGEHYAARAQVRLSRMAFDMGDYQPDADLPDPPQAEVQSEDHLTFFEFMVSVEFF